MLPWIDPRKLLPRTTTLLEALGPFLTDGLSYKEVAEKMDRSEEWVASRVRLLREDLAEHVLSEAGDELPAALRARLEHFARK